ncbi:MAG: tetratricopeptide repeat protein [Blastocatellales bacterium]
MKKTGKENNQPPPENKSARPDPRNQQPDASANSESGDQDPKAISESLRRIRTSGPLIIEAIKQKNDRINEIIAESVQGMSENKAGARREERLSPPPPPPPPPVQKSKKGERAANQKAKAQTARQTNAGSAGAKSANARQINQADVQAPPPSITQTAAQTVAAAVAATQSVARKTSGFLSGPATNRSHAQSASNTGQLPLNGPSTVLAQASGFKPQSSFGSKVRMVLIALAILLGAGAYFMFRDKLLPQAYTADSNRNLVSSEDQSAQFVRLGQQERDQGRHGAAMENFQHALELAPNNPNVRLLIAQTYLDAGQMDEAMRGYQQLLRIAPEHLDARLQLAGIYHARGNWIAAHKEYRNIIELNQNSPQAAAALEAIEKQQAEEQAETQTVQASLALSRGNRQRLRGNRLQGPNAPSLPGTAAGAQVPLLSQRITTAPGINPPAALNGARPEERPDPRTMADNHKKLGVRYLNVREFRAAINEFLQALNLTPDDKDLYYFIGSSHHGLGQYAEAYNYYRRVDTGLYVGPAQSGAKQTEKAARDASKRREPKFQSMKNQPENGSPNRSIMNRVVDTFRE